MKLVQDKVATYDPAAEEEADVEFKGDSIGWWELVTPFATCCDYTMLWIGLSMAFLFGASLPGFCLFFGGMIDDMGSGSNESKQLQDIVTAKVTAGTYTF